MSVSVSALSWSRSLGGVGEWITKGGGEFLMYGNNDLNTQDLNYSECSISKSVYPALIQDFNRDTLPDIIVFPDAETVEFYTSTCELISSFTIPDSEAIKDQPVITDWDNDVIFELTYLTNTSLVYVEIDLDADTYEFHNTNYTYLTDDRNLIFLSCTENHQAETGEFDRCYFFQDNNRTVYVWDYDTSLIYELHDELTNNTDLMSGYTKPVGSKTPTNYFIPHCFQESRYTGGYANCDLINASGKVTKNVELDWSATNGRPTEVYSGLVRIDSNFRIVTYIGDIADNANFMLDMNLNLIAEDQGSSTNPNSKPMVGDVDLDGLNEACWVQWGNAPYFECFVSSTSSSVESASKVYVIPTAVAYTTNKHSSVLGHWDKNSGLMCFVNGWGVFCSDNSTISGSHYNISYNHSITGNSLLWGTTASSTPYNQGYGVPMYVAGSSIITNVVVNNDLSATCGDGVCGITENIFTCPEDCKFEPQGNETCFDDDDCDPGLPTCLNNECVAGYNESQTCSVSTDCPINKFCHNGFCLIAVQNQSILQTTTDNENIIGNEIDNLFDIMAQGSWVIKLLIAVGIFSLFLALPFGFTKSMNANLTPLAILTGLIGLIVDVAFNLLPWYIPVLYAIACVGIGIATFKSGN